jgi:hypothetical protein
MTLKKFYTGELQMSDDEYNKMKAECEKHKNCIDCPYFPIGRAFCDFAVEKQWKNFIDKFYDEEII